MLDQPAEPDIQDLSRLYVIANTPTYLWRGLRRHPAVAALAALPADDLIQTLFALDDRAGDFDTPSAAFAYALLVALLQKNDLSAKEALKERRWKHLVWANQVIGIDQANQPTPTQITAIASARRIEPDFDVKGQSATTSRIVVVGNGGGKDVSS